MRSFNDALSDPHKFIVTLELVPGRESSGRSIGAIHSICRDAAEDGRITAVSITDSPGGNPALSPDVLGSEIRSYGLDVIVHFTCRDTNRVGMESRALQLAHMGMKNILALTGDYSGKGFGGRGTPVFDFDSVVLTSMLNDLNRRLIKNGHSEIFQIGCAVSPFKYTEAETWVQYKKLDRKIEAGSSFVITQLGYDAGKYAELLQYKAQQGDSTPVLASLYVLDRRSARPMHANRIPGVHVSDKLYEKVMQEWSVEGEGMGHAIERSARLGVILKGLGYRGIHIGGIHKSFDDVAAILDRMEELEDDWQQFLPEFCENHKGFYLYEKKEKENGTPFQPDQANGRLIDNCHYLFLRKAHDLFFDKGAAMAPVYRKISSSLERKNMSWVLKRVVEDPFKKLFLSCESCGDCGIQHVGFLCPESGCPKHTRNGPCGGSNDGYCEVNQDRLCVWVRAYHRMKRHGETEQLSREFIPPRQWELKGSSSWINFHLDRDHQGRRKAA